MKEYIKLTTCDPIIPMLQKSDLKEELPPCHSSLCCLYYLFFPPSLLTTSGGGAFEPNSPCNAIEPQTLGKGAICVI